MYHFLKIWLRLALQFYIRRIAIDKSHGGVGPRILACNHPNSFFDALVIAAYHTDNIYYLARGDAFKKPAIGKLLTRLHLIPIYRLEEGKENLAGNERSFAMCLDVLKSGGIVLIFPEGLSRHEWKVRPLRKGAARLAFMAWKQLQITDMQVQPVGLTYHSFVSVPKNVVMKFPQLIKLSDLDLENEGIFYNNFNSLLKQRLEESTLQAESDEDKKNLLPQSRATSKRMLLALPAFAGYVSQRWFYILWRNFAAKKTKDTVFYDSVLFATMMITYPFFVLIITAIIVAITGSYIAWLLLIFLPFVAWCYKEYKGTFI